METKSFRAILVITFLILAGGFIVQETAFSAESFHLGIALGLSGTGAPYCKEAVEGLEIAVNEINAQGGLLEKVSLFMIRILFSLVLCHAVLQYTFPQQQLQW